MRPHINEAQAILARGEPVFFARPPSGLERVKVGFLLTPLSAECAVAMAQPTASIKASINEVNRQFETAYKPNHVDAKMLFDACAAERNFLKRFNNDHHGSAALVKQVVSQKAPYLCLRNTNNDTHWKSTSASAGSFPNGVGKHGQPASASAGSFPNGVSKGGKGQDKGRGK